MLWFRTPLTNCNALAASCTPTLHIDCIFHVMCKLYGVTSDLNLQEKTVSPLENSAIKQSV